MVAPLGPEKQRWEERVLCDTNFPLRREVLNRNCRHIFPQYASPCAGSTAWHEREFNAQKNHDQTYGPVNTCTPWLSLANMKCHTPLWLAWPQTWIRNSARHRSPAAALNYPDQTWEALWNKTYRHFLWCKCVQFLSLLQTSDGFGN